MTPKEKAKEIVNKFYYYVESFTESQQKKNAKQCALISIELKLDSNFLFSNIEYGEESSEYWEQVKKEIEIL